MAVLFVLAVHFGVLVVLPSCVHLALGFVNFGNDRNGHSKVISMCFRGVFVLCSSLVGSCLSSMSRCAFSCWSSVVFGVWVLVFGCSGLCSSPDVFVCACLLCVVCAKL